MSTVTFTDAALVTSRGAGNAYGEDFTFAPPAFQGGNTATGEELVLNGASFQYTDITPTSLG